MELPSGTGMKLQENSDKSQKVVNLVLQIHYVSLEQHPDRHSQSNGEEGIVLQFPVPSSPKQMRPVGILRMEANGGVIPRGVVTVETACRISQPVNLNVYGYLVHTHALGFAVTGWKIGPDAEWAVIGKADPRINVSLISIPEKQVVIKAGDIIATRCTFNNTMDRDVMLK